MEQLLQALLNQILSIDALVAEWILELRNPIATNVVTSVTGLGSVAAGIVLVGMFHLAGWQEEFSRTLIALALTGVVVAALMTIINRPFPPHPVCETDSVGTPTTSFPSGHAAAVTVYAMVARSSERLPFRAVAALAALIAFSRIYLGTHYLSDTVAGIGIGIGAALLAERILERTEPGTIVDAVPIDGGGRFE
jgi:membrane-associated phospholipid phosphatase